MAGLLLLAGCVTGPPAPPAPASPADARALVAALPPAVVTVRTAGWWRSADAEGPYRIVILETGFDEIVARVFLQWIAVGDGAGGRRTVSTVGFREVNDPPLYALAIEGVDEAGDGLRVRLAAASPRGGPDKRFVILAGGPGVARLQKME